MTDTVKTCPKCSKPMIEAVIAGDSFDFHTCQPLRLLPSSVLPRTKNPVCPNCDVYLTDSDRGDGSVKEMVCPKCNKIIPEWSFKFRGEIGPLGTFPKSKRAPTTYVAISANSRVISQGPRSNPNLSKNRTLNRNLPDESLGLRPEDIPLLAGQEDKDMLELLNHGVMISLVTTGEDSEE